MTPILGLPPTASQQVKPFVLKTAGFVVAQSGDCLGIMRREAAFDPKKRRFYAIEAKALKETKFTGSWFLGVMVCPGDSTSIIAEWAKTLPKRDLGRIRFYFYAGVDLRKAMAAWVSAGLPDPLFNDEVGRWEDFHQHFGGHHATQVFHDFVAKPPTGIS